MKKALLIVFALLINLTTVAQADEYRFTCKNMFGAVQIVKLEAATEQAARMRIRKEKEFADFNNCRFLQVIKKEQIVDKQNSWGGRFKDKLKMMLQTPPTGIGPNSQSPNDPSYDGERQQ